jgi:C4-type Zn-finger protein
MELNKQLDELLEQLVKKEISITQFQSKLSVILYSQTEFKNIESLVKKIDNEIELIIFTAREEDQLNEVKRILRNLKEELKSN